MSLLTLLKGLPMTYNRDLQEDKERLFDTADTVRACTRLLTAMLLHTEVNHKQCAAAAGNAPCSRPIWRIISSAKASSSARRIILWAEWWRWPKNPANR